MQNSHRILPILLLTNLVASILHFGDNMLRFAEYPEPQWIKGPHVVDGLWVLITPLLALGLFLSRRQNKWAAVVVLWTYGILSLSVLGHYRFASPMDLPFRINLFIGVEAMAAALLIVAAPIVVPRTAISKT